MALSVEQEKLKNTLKEIKLGYQKFCKIFHPEFVGDTWARANLEAAIRNYREDFSVELLYYGDRPVLSLSLKEEKLRKLDQLCYGDRPVLSLCRKEKVNIERLDQLQQLFLDCSFEILEGKKSNSIMVYSSLKHRNHWNHTKGFPPGYTVAAMLAEFPELCTSGEFDMAKELPDMLPTYEADYRSDEEETDRKNVTSAEAELYEELHLGALKKIVKICTPPNALESNENEDDQDQLGAYFERLAKRTFPQEKSIDDLYSLIVTEMWVINFDSFKAKGISTVEELIGFFRDQELENVIKSNIETQQTRSANDKDALLLVKQGWDYICQKIKKCLDALKGTKSARENIKYEDEFVEKVRSPKPR